MSDESEHEASAEPTSEAPDVADHTRRQLARELAARQSVARGAGLALLDLTAVFEEGNVVIDQAVDPLGSMLLVFAARGRRLLRSSYRLLDAGEAPEAVPLLRVLTEIYIVSLWLRQDATRFPGWVKADHSDRLKTLRKMWEAAGESPEIRELVQHQIDTLSATEEDYSDEFKEVPVDTTSVETMAQKTKLGFAYQYAYRIQSQSDVHASSLMADNFLERLPDGHLRILDEPDYGLGGLDQYALGAHLLLDLLAVVDDVVPGLLWRNGLAGVRDSLEGLRATDPGKEADRIAVLLTTSGIELPQESTGAT